MPNETRFAIREERNLRIPLSDGTSLAANVYFPESEDPLPALVSYYPYHKDDLIGAMFDDSRRYFAERGYVELLVDFRGTGASEGYCWETFDAEREGADGAEIVEWIAQQPWCDGNVGMWGMSYGGITTFNVAAHQPPHLRACLPLFGSPDIYRDFIYPGGIPNAIGNGLRETFMLAMDLAPPTYSDGAWRERWREHLKRLQDDDLWGLRWQSHGDYDEHWRARTPDLSKIEAPTFFIGGWNDIFPDGMIRAYEAMSVPRKLVMGPWVHVTPHTSVREPWDWLHEAVRWWDRWLKDDDNGIDDEPPVTLFVQGEDEWRNTESWPPPGTRQQRYHLAAEGGLGLEAPAKEDGDTYVADLTVGVRGMLLDPLGTGLGYPLDQGSDNLRSLSYTTAPLDEELYICGAPEAIVSVVLEDGDGFDLVTKLSAVGPDGHASHVATGWLNGRHADGHEHPRDPVPGSPETYRIRLWATTYHVPAGHRLHLSIACADFPHSLPTKTRPTIRVLHGGEHPSGVDIPLAPSLAGPSGGPALRRPDASVPPASFVVRAAPDWRIEEDLANERVSVTYGTALDLALPHGPEFHIDYSGTATATNARPDGAKVNGTAHIEVRLETGELVSVEASSQITRDTMLMNGRVSIDGLVLVDRHWSNY